MLGMMLNLPATLDQGRARIQEGIEGCRGSQRSLLPQRGQAERLGEEHVAELPRIHLNGGPGIERPTEALLPRLTRDGTDPARNLAGAACLRQTHLQRLLSPAQGPADEHGAKEP